MAAESSRQVQRVEWPGARLRAAVVVIAAVAGSWLGLSGLRTPPPVPPSEPVFSADRAASMVTRLLGPLPRPVGSVANELGVRRLAEWLRSTGMEVEVDEAPVRVGGKELKIRNIVARRTGAMPGDAVMLCAHHDTARLAPGAGDDGMGLAIVLEAAAALSGEPWKGRDVVLLITDGEEAGLLGARHFVANHPWREKIGTVINVDNRGTAGPALIYETAGDDDARILQVITPMVGPVVGNSLFASIASAMPNGSDLAVFREAGIHGINIAVIGGHEHYHTATDTWDNVDRSSLQHEGQLALAALYALGMERADAHRAEGHPVFLDIAGQALAWWPTRAGATIALLSTLGIVAAGWLSCRRLRGRRSTLIAGAIATVVRAIVAGAVCAGLLFAAQSAGLWGSAAAQAAMPDADARALFIAAWWPAAGPWMLLVAMVAAIVVAWKASGRMLRGHGGFVALCGAWAAIAAATAAVAILMPAASASLLPISVAAAFAFGAAITLDPGSGKAALVAMALPTFVAGLTLAPIEALAWTGVGLSMTPFAAVRCAVYAALLLTPLASPRASV